MNVRIYNTLVVQLVSNQPLRMSDVNSRLTLPSDLQNVNQVEPFVNVLAQRFNLCPEVHGNILLSLTEAVTNAILHGNRSDCSKQVSISLRRLNDALSIKVSDEGPGFNPGEVPDPTCPERITECGGRGIFLMRRFSDECRFSHGGRTVEMRFKL